MIDELNRLLAVNGYLPHGYCISWSPPLLWTYVVSDVLIFLSYFSMPVALVYFARRRQDFPYRWLLWMFAFFIMACGATHLMGAIVLWQPLYGLDALLKAITALVSVATAAVLWPLMPHALKLPSPGQLMRANEALTIEIAVRKGAEDELRLAKEEAEDSLHKERMLMAAIVESSADAIIGKTLDGIVTSWNQAAQRMFGYSATEIVGRTLYELIPPEGQEEDGKLLDAIRRGESISPFETQWVCKNGRRIDVSVTASPIRDKEGKIIGVAKIARDITERKRTQAAVAESRHLLQTIIDTAPIRVFWKDLALRYMGCNPAFARDAGKTSPDEVVGKDDYQMGWADQAEQYREDDRKVLESGKPKLFYEESLTTPDGKTMWVQSAKVPLKNRDNETIGLLGTYADITARKQAEGHIQYLAHYDALTGLPNRSQLDDRARYALSLAQRSREPVALMFLDLDHFKDINDTLGHTVGDALLVELAKRLGLLLRDEDTVSRLGGDEFIFLLHGIDAQGAAHVAQKVLEAIARPYRIEQYDLNVTGSIGIALFPGDGANLETLYKNADAAMYRAKQEGRNGYRFFTAEMQASSARHLQLVNALRQALEHEEMELHYQPQVSMRDGRIVGAEALLRWTHSELGSVPPAEFIPSAEDSGLILPIGEWVLRHAVRQAKRWLQGGLAPLVMAVNLSAVQFRHPDLPSLVSRILDEEGLPPEYLELELTEGVAMHDPQGAIAVMNQLHERGVRMSIDDFGTGYSSLSHLKKFKVYKLKIDQSFVRDISTDPEDKAIVGAIIRMAQSLGLLTIAEGVETEGQRAFLRDQGCDEMQGYFFSKALPADQFELFVGAKAR